MVSLFAAASKAFDLGFGSSSTSLGRLMVPRWADPKHRPSGLRSRDDLPVEDPAGPGIPTCRTQHRTTLPSAVLQIGSKRFIGPSSPRNTRNTLWAIFGHRTGPVGIPFSRVTTRSSEATSRSSQVVHGSRLVPRAGRESRVI